MRSITSSCLALPMLARWVGASGATASASTVQPGRLAQGPDAKLGLAGRRPGLGMAFIIVPSSQKGATRWEVVARGAYRRLGVRRQRRRLQLPRGSGRAEKAAFAATPHADARFFADFSCSRIRNVLSKFKQISAARFASSGSVNTCS